MTENSGITNQRAPHNIIMEDRRHLTVSGVSDIDSFDEQSVVVYTEMGELTVKGNDLHINRLSLEMGELLVEGDIYALIYADKEERQSGGGFFSKVFR